MFLDNVFVPDDYVVGEVNHGFRYISQALDLERFTMFTFSPIKQRLDLLTEWVQDAERDGEALREDPRVRARLANLHTEAEVARVLGLKFVAEAVKVEQAVRDGKEGFQPPTVAASEYKLYATELSKRLADASMDIAGPGSQLRVHTDRCAHGRSLRVDLPLHGDRHHRRGRLGDPEEHHRPGGAWGSPRTSENVPMAAEPCTLTEPSSMSPWRPSTSRGMTGRTGELLEPPSMSSWRPST